MATRINSRKQKEKQEEKQFSLKYVTSLKDQIKLLELETKLLKSDRAKQQAQTKGRDILIEESKIRESNSEKAKLRNIHNVSPSSEFDSELEKAISLTISHERNQDQDKKRFPLDSQCSGIASPSSASASSVSKSSNNSQLTNQRRRKTTTSSSSKFSISKENVNVKSNNDVEVILLKLKEKHRLLQIEHKNELLKKDEEMQTLKQKLARMAIDLADSKKHKHKALVDAEDFINRNNYNLEQKLETFSELEERVKTLQIENVQLTNDLHICQCQIRDTSSSHEMEVHSLKEERDDLARALELANTLNQEVELRYSDQLADYASMKRKVENFNLIETELTEKLNAFKVSYESLRSDLAGMHQQQKLRDERIKNIEAECERLARENSKLEGKMEDYSRELAAANGRENALSKYLKEATHEKLSAEILAKSHQQKAEEALHILETEKLELKEKHTQLTKLQSEVDFLKDKIVGAENMADKCKKRCEELEKNLAPIKAQNDLLNAQMKTLEANKFDLSTKITKLEQEKAFLTLQNKSLEERAELANDLEKWDIKNLQSVMQTNLDLASRFDQFLKKHLQSDAS